MSLENRLDRILGLDQQQSRIFKTLAQKKEIDWAKPTIDIIPEPNRKPKNAFCGDSLGGKIAEMIGKLGIPCNFVTATDSAAIQIFHFNLKNLPDIAKLGRAVKNLELLLGCDVIQGGAVFGDFSLQINKDNRDTVYFKDALWAIEQTPFNFVIGQRIDGEYVQMTLKQMVHMLVGGETRSGKSVAKLSMLTSLLYNTPPNMLELYLADFKKVEFTAFEDLPHLAAPIINDTKTLTRTILQLVAIMGERYKIMQKFGLQEVDENCPHILFIIDEFADAISQAKQQIEPPLKRLLKMGRAAGIHVIISTQRPTVDIVTGSIKANMPTIAGLKTNTAMSSRVIVDETGLEKLAGLGDCLFKRISGMGKLERLQFPFIDTKTIKAVVDFWAMQDK